MIENTSELLDHIVEATILALVVDPGYREGWFSVIRTIKLQPSHKTDKQLGTLIDAIVRLLIGDKFMAIQPALLGVYEQAWQQIGAALVTSQDLRKAITQFLSANTFVEVKAALDKWEEYLVSEGVDQALKEMIVQANETDDAGAYQNLLQHRTLLARCRIFGSSVALAEIEGEGAYPIIREEDLNRISDVLSIDKNTLTDLLVQFPELLPVTRCVYRVNDESNIRSRLDRLSELLNSFPQSESVALPSIALWEGPFGPPLLEHLEISLESIRHLCKLDFCVEYIDADGDPWFFFPDFVLSHFAEGQEIEERKERHRAIARYLRKAVLKMWHDLSAKQVPLELIRHTEGKPLGVLQEDLIEYMFALQFLSRASNQTENLHFAETIVGVAQRWHHHLLEAAEFHLAMNVAAVLKDPLIRWGRLDEAQSLIFGTADRWQEFEPENTEEIMKEVFRALDYDVSEENLEKSRGDDEKNEPVLDVDGGQTAGAEHSLEQLHTSIREYESQENLEGQAYAYYRLSKEYFHLRNFRESFEANYISEELAILMENKLLLANILLLRGRSIAASGNHEDGIRVLHKSLQLLEAANDVRAIGECHLWLGASFTASNKADEAIEHLNIALATAEHFFDDAEIARTLLSLGMAHDMLGDQEQALAYLTRAKDLYDKASREDFVPDLESYISLLNS